MKPTVETERSEMATKYYSMAEVAVMLGISRSYLHQLKNARRLKVKRVGFQFEVSEREVERLRQERNGDKDGK